MQYSPGPGVTHVNHLENRLAYAERVLEWLDKNIPQAKAANMAAMNRATWDRICRQAGEMRSPSEATIGVVIGMARMRERLTDQAYGRPTGRLLSKLPPAPEAEPNRL